MITIDVLDTHTTRTEKPYLQNQARLQTLEMGTLDYRMVLAQNQLRGMQRAAHTAHLLKISRAGNLAVDVQRLLENSSAKVLTLAERYVFRR
ncbi:MAG: hypothetical protein A2Z45_11240 [Chloroflexi bacterium RBG_19FT_COMBO_55_16]|nr:MAG: hypothetical protein A2Z45_11240 [Chloroflexi bacterium RBG_19FT_COMBO_55_16]